MSQRTGNLLAWGSLVLGASLTGVAVAMLALAGPVSPLAPPSSTTPPDGLLGAFVPVLPFVAFGLVGAVVASRRSGNRIGWLLCAAGLVTSFSSLAGAIGYWGILARPGSIGAAPLAEWAADTLYTPTIPLTTTFLFLLFPDGHLPSRRWRPVLWASAVGAALGMLGNAIAPSLYGLDTIVNPVLPAPRTASEIVGGIGFLLVMVSLLASIVALVMRFRRARGEAREQLKWFAFAALLTLVFAVPALVLDDVPAPLYILASFAALCIPLAVAIAILRYHLYDIDVVINKTLVFTSLFGFITAVYVVLVVGVGSALGHADDPALSIGATALVALAFQPMRERVQRLANQLVYGQRATPYEVMAGFSRRVADTPSVGEVLPQMAQAAARGVGASAARVRVFLPGSQPRSEVWPVGAIFDGSSTTLEVGYQGEEVGELTVAKPPGEPLTSAENKLLHDLTSQAGLALHNVRLTEELAIRLNELAAQSEQLRVSRQRLVTARDAQRRGLERDIHEGPERQLREIRHRLVQLGSNGATAAPELDALGEKTNATLEGLRDLARGIFPPLLAEKGLATALEAHIRKVGANAVVEAPAGFAERRFDDDIEACVYFCCLQTIQNVLRHAGNAACTVRLAAGKDLLSFEVEDRGPGFDPTTTEHGMGLQIVKDRVDALEGTLAIASVPGRGTTVTVELPVRATERIGGDPS
jgi:signal transduction histidine kinase